MALKSQAYDASILREKVEGCLLKTGEVGGRITSIITEMEIYRFFEQWWSVWEESFWNYRRPTSVSQVKWNSRTSGPGEQTELSLKESWSLHTGYSTHFGQRYLQIFNKWRALSSPLIPGTWVRHGMFHIMLTQPWVEVPLVCLF